MTDIYATSTGSRDARRLASVAALHTEEAATEADRIRATIPDGRISPSVRLGLGYTDNARAAADKLENNK